MKRLSSIALILVALCAIQIKAHSQSAYRCGNSYSQTPCPGGVSVDAADGRSNAQKTQSDVVIQRDRTTADSMEKSRLQQEEALRRNQGTAPKEPAVKTTSTDQKKTQPLHPARKNKLRNPDNFTAKAPIEKKKKKPANATAAP